MASNGDDEGANIYECVFLQFVKFRSPHRITNEIKTQRSMLRLRTEFTGIGIRGAFIIRSILNLTFVRQIFTFARDIIIEQRINYCLRPKI